jgi:pimeloyl-ACP methyl ester carboxylesterase
LLENAGEKGPFVLAGHSAGGLYVLNFARLYESEVAGVVLIDSMHPEQYERIGSWPAFYEAYRRVSAIAPSLSRFGLGRVVYGSAYGELPAAARDQARAFWATPRHARSVRDEFSEIRTAMAQAALTTGLGNRPLIVVTAGQQGADWMEAQDDLATLSTNVEHRVVANASHGSLVESAADAAESGAAVRDVVAAVRNSQLL